jgi:ABC-type nitrate/sulfonate/bicarbonate transport system permease component
MTVSDAGQLTSGPAATSSDTWSRGRSLTARLWGWRIGTIVVVLAAWETMAASVGEDLLPSIGSVIVDGVPSLISGGHAAEFGHTLVRMMIGFAIACAIALPAGALMGASKAWNDILSPYAYGIYMAPRPALLPLLILTFGVGTTFGIVMVVLFAVFFPLINTAKGASEVVNGPLYEMTRSLQISRVRVLLFVLIPGSLPYVLAGIRLGLGMAFNGILLAELWTAYSTGGLLQAMISYHQLPEYFALAGLIGLTAVASYSLLGVFERRVRRRRGMAVTGSFGEAS